MTSPKEYSSYLQQTSTTRNLLMPDVTLRVVSSTRPHESPCGSPYTNFTMAARLRQMIDVSSFAHYTQSTTRQRGFTNRRIPFSIGPPALLEMGLSK